ncbi:MAG: Glu-tRNA(Gln) amidotransferase GatDE subunit D, partial [Candidatus Thermoplasmatota archaeon]|nr:Glu-tRNA(Gln) amidotransferase GatDE subunit D [Candidatus Thermoplasmatota archaeon]
HIRRDLIPKLAELVEQGTFVVVASQCLQGRTNLRVYETGRQLVQAGCLEAGDMLPETAYVKLAWALGTAGDPKEAIDLFQAPRGREQAPTSSFHYLTGGDA